MIVGEEERLGQRNEIQGRGRGSSFIMRGSKRGCSMGYYIMSHTPILTCSRVIIFKKAQRDERSFQIRQFAFKQLGYAGSPKDRIYTP